MTSQEKTQKQGGRIIADARCSYDARPQMRSRPKEFIEFLCGLIARPKPTIKRALVKAKVFIKSGIPFLLWFLWGAIKSIFIGSEKAFKVDKMKIDTLIDGEDPDNERT